MNSNLRNKVITGLLWKTFEQSGVQLVNFIIQILLARLLLPSDYGIIAIASIFITISSTVVQSGFSRALIQKEYIDDIDCSSIFFFNIIVSIVLYIIIYLIAPKIAILYNAPILLSVLRIQGVIIIIGGFSSIQISLISKLMDFKKSFSYNLIATTAQGVIGVSLAIAGYGVWALVISQIVYQITGALILWMTVKWRPIKSFSMKRLNILFKFGSKILLSSLIDTSFNSFYSLLIGKVYSKEVLAFYNRGQQIPILVSNNINGPLMSVLFPAFSSLQNDILQLKKTLRRSISVSSFFVFPIMFGLIAIAKPLTILLLTEKWLMSVPFMQIACINVAFWAVHNSNIQALNSIGRSDITLSLEILRKVLIAISVLFLIDKGIHILALGYASVSIISIIINSVPIKKNFKYTYREQLYDFLPALGVSILMGVFVYSLSLINVGIILTLVMQITFGITFYIIASRIIKIDSYMYVIVMINTLLKGRRKNG